MRSDKRNSRYRKSGNKQSNFSAGVAVKQTSTQKVYRAVPKAPTPHSPTVNSPSSVDLQFGSITPGFMRGIQLSVSELDPKDNQTSIRFQAPDEKKDGTITPESMPVPIDLKHGSADATIKQDVATDPVPQSKPEPDHCQDAADMSTPSLDTFNSGDLVIKDHCADMPEGLDTTPQLEPLIVHGLHPNIPDERWQHANGLISSPHTPLQVMHRADNKYEIWKVSDEVEAKLRRLQAILNKLTLRNFEKLFQQVKAVNIDNLVTLSFVISQTFDKALTEPTFCEMYANFYHRLAGVLPDFSEDNERITFKRLLLNKCQEEFERGELEQEEANRAEEGEIKQSKEEREDKRVQARRRRLGNIRLIGELYTKKMLTERIMHSCINKLLGQNEDPDVEDIESLCKLMSTIGEIIDHPKAKVHMDAYFDIMGNLSNNTRLSSRVRFMLKDVIDLRRNKWQQTLEVEGTKKIDEVHWDVAQERNAQASRLRSRPSMSSSVRRSTPMQSSLNSQMGNFRGYAPQLRGYVNQGVRSDERQSYEARHMSVFLPQRPVGVDSITLAPQGGLARGMWNRRQQAMPSVSVAELSPGHGDLRRMPGGVNGYNASTERTPYGSKEFFLSRQVSDRYVGPSDQSSGQEHYMPRRNRAGHSFEGPLAASPAPQVQEPAINLSETGLPEDCLHEKSITAIKEYYSEWIDPPMCERSDQIISGLLRKIDAMEICTQEIRENAKNIEMKIWSLLAISWFVIVFLLMLM